MNLSSSQCNEKDCIKIALPTLAQAPGSSTVIEALAAAEDLARRTHRGLFEYGDPGDEDEDEAPPRPAWGRR